MTESFPRLFPRHDSAWYIPQVELVIPFGSQHHLCSKLEAGNLTVSNAVNDPADNQLRECSRTELEDCTDGTDGCTDSECFFASQPIPVACGNQTAEEIPKLSPISMDIS